MRDTEHATSPTPLALRRATLCFHFIVEPYSPEGPENVKVKYPQFENSILVLTEFFMRDTGRCDNSHDPLVCPK